MNQLQIINYMCIVTNVLQIINIQIIIINHFVKNKDLIIDKFENNIIGIIYIRILRHT